MNRTGASNRTQTVRWPEGAADVLADEDDYRIYIWIGGKNPGALVWAIDEDHDYLLVDYLGADMSGSWWIPRAEVIPTAWRMHAGNEPGQQPFPLIFEGPDGELVSMDPPR